jgi:medium-chain acyl-[acyl-carrier-protein] hydrolase
MDDLPVALLGYCSGAFVAYEVARRLDRAGRPAQALVVLASPGPRIVRPDRRVHDLPVERLIEYLRSARVTPESILADRQLFEMFLPAIRADFETYETWDPLENGRVAALSAPVIVIGARADESVDQSDLLMWSDLTTDQFTLRMLPGGHDFLSASAPEVGRVLATDLCARQEWTP